MRDKMGEFFGDDGNLLFFATNIGDPLKVDAETGCWMQGLEVYPIPANGKYDWKLYSTYLPLLPESAPRDTNGQ